jgi:3-hydroxybutyryl-CoA dehydratase
MSFTTFHMYYDDVAVDQEWESLGRTITETDIANFAGISGDFNPIHMDHEFAKTTMFQRPIAHGLLLLSLASGLGLHAPPMRTIAFLALKEWHFDLPVFIGDTVRLRTKILAKTDRARGRFGVVTWQRQLVNQHGKIVQHGITETLVEGRANVKHHETHAGDATRPKE